MHVDGIKLACAPAVLREFIAALGKVFGKDELDVTPDNFTNCGLRHIPKPDGYTMDQTEYLAALKPITGSDLTIIFGTDPAPPWAA